MNAASLRRWAQQLLSGKDNSTPDLARHAWLLANLAIIGTAAVATAKGIPVSLTELAGALGIANTSGAVATKLKETTEPDAQPPDTQPPDAAPSSTPPPGAKVQTKP